MVVASTRQDSSLGSDGQQHQHDNTLGNMRSRATCRGRGASTPHLYTAANHLTGRGTTPAIARDAGCTSQGACGDGVDDGLADRDAVGDSVDDDVRLGDTVTVGVGDSLGGKNRSAIIRPGARRRFRVTAKWDPSSTGGAMPAKVTMTMTSHSTSSAATARAMPRHTRRGIP